MNIKNKRTSDILTIVLFLAILFGLSGLFVFQSDSRRSDFEGRELQVLPESVELDDVLHGRFAKNMDSYFCDQFPFRREFMSFKAGIELALGKGENNGVLYGSGGQLAVKDFKAAGVTGDTIDFYDEKTVLSAISALNSVGESLKESGIELKAVLPPRTIDVAASAFDYPDEPSSALNELIESETDGEIYVPVLDKLRALYDAGEYVYYRTDHHWTALGAYYAYDAIIESLGGEAYPLEYFSFEEASGSFYGTTWRNSGFYFVGSDSLYLPRFEGDGDFTVEILNRDGSVNRVESGFYDLSKLDTEDKYSTYLYGKNDYMRISRKAEDGGGRESLLIVKDSFAHSLAPFLALHYDLIIVDLDADSFNSFTPRNISRTAKDLGVSKVLIVYNLENIITNDRLASIT